MTPSPESRDESATANSQPQPEHESSSAPSEPMSLANWQKGITLAALSLAQQEKPELLPPDARDEGPARDLLGQLVSEPATRRGPEPTIRTDGRQETMPETGTVMSRRRAAQDQAGRGTLRAEGEQRHG